MWRARRPYASAGVVVLPDHTMMMLTVAVGGSFVSGHEADCVDFGEAVLGSVSKGRRDLALAAGPVRFARVRIEKTAGSVLTHGRMPDWDEYSLQPVVP